MSKHIYYQRAIIYFKKIMTTTIKSSVRTIAAAALLGAMLLGPLMANAATLLTRQLQMGMTGSDVSTLQTFLAADPSIYPQGLVTGYFGFLTKSAVSNFQVRNGIAAVGRVGPITLAAINAQILAGGVTGGGDVTVPALSAVNITTATNSATFGFSTNEATRATVYYGTTPLSEYELPHSVTIGGSVATDNSLNISHSITLSGLQSNTTYYYDVYVTDTAGNATMTMQTTFRTTN